MPIYNLTQHNLTAAQTEAGAVELPPELRAEMRALLTIDGDALKAPTPVLASLLESRASAILAMLWPLYKTAFAARVAEVNETCCAGLHMEAMNELKEPILTVLIGGFPPLMDRLIPLLKAHSVQPTYALSERVVTETTDPATGAVTKTATFAHLGWFPA